MTTLDLEFINPSDLITDPTNPRAHPPSQIDQIAASMTAFGNLNPILVTGELRIIAGHGRYLAAVKLGLTSVPIIRLGHLSEAQCKALRIADNKIALNAVWDIEVLAHELELIGVSDIEISLTGFTTTEIDLTLEQARLSAVDGNDDTEDEPVPVQDGRPVTNLGDVWLCGRHRLVCGDAQDPQAYLTLMGEEKARMVFTDPPYNVKIDKNVCGSGGVRHPEFAMASGEMPEAVFTDFLATANAHMASCCVDGALLYVCMDWRHLHEMEVARRTAELELKNLIVWNKTNAGMGSFYRSQHELVFIMKSGTAPHLNTFGLGSGGRSRTNVWTYPGVNTFRAGRMNDLKMHPTVKPVALVRDAIMDASRRGELVLDPFGGSGTTLIAAESVGRRARLIEIDPHYCDVIVRRWQALTGKSAVREADGVTFTEVEAQTQKEAA